MAEKWMCVVPVRGGSKGLPRKNALPVKDDISLLEWTLREAQKSILKESLVVSTEDAELAAIASRCGVKVALRPEALARDESTTAEVIAHLLAQQDEGIETLCVLQATSPLRTVADIDAAAALMAQGGVDSVVSVCAYEGVHPAKMYVETDGGAQPVMQLPQSTRRQERSNIFVRNGAIYMVRRPFFDETGSLWGGKTALLKMPKERSIDIDTLADLDAARVYLAAS